MIIPEFSSGVDFDADYLIRLGEVVSKIKTARVSLGIAPGNISGSKRGRGSILYDLRLWSEGDDIRHIDSHRTARTGVPHVRTYHDDQENRILFIADFRPSMYFGTRRVLRSVSAAEAISISGWRAISMQACVGLATSTVCGVSFLGWARESCKFSGLLDKFAVAHRQAGHYDKSYEPDLSDILDLVEKTSGSTTIVIATALDTPGEDFYKIARIMAQRRKLLFLLISDKFERAPNPGNYPYSTREGDRGILQIHRKYEQKPKNDKLLRLSDLGARSIIIHTELEPTDIVRVLERIYDRSR